jgi:flagellar basal-body rod protein FlgC
MSLFSAISVSASGMEAERTRAELLTQNLANAETTRTPEGGPYRRRDAVFSSGAIGEPFSSAFQSSVGEIGVTVADIVTDQSEPDKQYMPGHPDADADGYVGFPHVNPAEDMVDLLDASHSYQANVSAIAAVKDMIQRSIELFK